MREPTRYARLMAGYRIDGNKETPGPAFGWYITFGAIVRFAHARGFLDASRTGALAARSGKAPGANGVSDNAAGVVSAEG